MSIWPPDRERWQKVNCLQPVSTSSVVGLRRNSIALPKAKLEQINKGRKKRHEGTVTVTVWWSAVSLSHTAAVWKPVKSSLLGSVLHISMRYTENYGMTASIGQQAGPDCSLWQYHPISQKLNERGSKVCLICHIHLTSAASSIPSALFREKVFKISKMQILKKMIS